LSSMSSIQIALASGDETALRTELLAASGLPGPRLNLRLVSAFARAAGEMVQVADAPVAALEELLDRWAGLDAVVATADRPEVILPCAAVAAYGEIGAVRPDWWPDEIAKLRRAATDTRWRVREVVALALQRLLAADWDRTSAAMLHWASSDDPLVIRAAVAGVAEPSLLRSSGRASVAAAVQRRGVHSYSRLPDRQRRTESGRVLRQSLGFTISIAVAATGDFTLLDEMAGSGDADLCWVAAENVRRKRLQRWPERVERVKAMLVNG
jgi:hypothetical protein